MLLGWRPNEFWDSTPADLASILSAVNRQSDDPADSNVIAQMMELTTAQPLARCRR